MGWILKVSKKETLALLMKIDEGKSELDKKRLEKNSATPKSRGIGKNKLKKSEVQS